MSALEWWLIAGLIVWTVAVTLWVLRHPEE
jgi:hypothetical protein